MKLVIFDWNGTLLADAHACLDADNHVLQTFGGKPIDLNTYRKTVVIPAIDFLIQHGCDRNRLIKETKLLGNVFHHSYEPRASKVRTRINAHKLLHWLHRNKITSIIVSNHTVVGIESQLQRLKLEKYFSKLLANTDLVSSMKKRGKKEKVEDYLKDTTFKKSEVTIIGDSPEEVEIGKHLGITTIAITDGLYSTPRLIKSNPDYLITNLKEVIDIIKNI